MQRRTRRTGWLDAVVLVNAVFVLGVAAWATNRLTPSVPVTSAPAADAATTVADATMVADEFTASLSPSPYPALMVVMPPQPGPSVLGPDDPYGVGSSCSIPISMTERLRQADIVALGTIVGVAPPRWTTPDGARPANPHVGTGTIYTPVVIQVERYLKGEQLTQQLGLLELGGRIGEDFATSCFIFNKGDRVVLFLRPPYFKSVTYNDLPMWAVSERFWVQGEQVQSPEGWSAPLPQVLADIERAQQP